MVYAKQAQLGILQALHQWQSTPCSYCAWILHKGNQDEDKINSCWLLILISNLISGNPTAISRLQLRAP